MFYQHTINQLLHFERKRHVWSEIKVDDKRPYTSSNTISIFSGVVFGNKDKRKKYNFFLSCFLQLIHFQIVFALLLWQHDNRYVYRKNIFSLDWYQYLMCHYVLIKFMSYVYLCCDRNLRMEWLYLSMMKLYSIIILFFKSVRYIIDI